MSDKKYDLFHDILIFEDLPVHYISKVWSWYD